MGRKCCVPKCKSNYRKIYTTVFNFPNDPDRRDLWLRSINREDFHPSRTAVVCIKHFEDRFIVTEDRAVRDDGSVLVVTRQKLALTFDAYPTIFDITPPGMVGPLKTPRKKIAVPNIEVMDQDEKVFTSCTDDRIESFEQLTSYGNSKLNGNWLSREKTTFILFCNIQDAYCPKIVASFKVFRDLTVKAWYEDKALCMKFFDWLLGPKSKCDSWTKFDGLLGMLTSYGGQKQLTAEQSVHPCVIKDEIVIVKDEVLSDAE